jgi:hypothetical protein
MLLDGKVKISVGSVDAGAAAPEFVGFGLGQRRQEVRLTRRIRRPPRHSDPLRARSPSVRQPRWQKKGGVDALDLEGSGSGRVQVGRTEEKA